MPSYNQRGSQYPSRGTGSKRAAKRRRRRRMIRLGGVLFLLMAAILCLCGYLAWPGMTAYCLFGAAAVALVGAVCMFALRTKPVWAVAIGIVILLGVAVLTNSSYVNVGGVNCKKDILTLDLSGTGAEDIKNVDRLELLQVLNANGLGLEYDPVLESCVELRSLDFRGNRMTMEQYTALSAALPRCEILWDVTINGVTYDGGLTHLTASSDTINSYSDLVTVLDNLENLQEADISRLSLTDAEVNELLLKYPNVTFQYAVTVFGVRTATNVSELDLSGAEIPDTQTLIDKLSVFTGLTKLTVLNSNLVYTDVKRINSAYPNLNIIYTVSLAERSFASDSQLVDLSGTQRVALNALIEGLTQFKALKTLDLTDAGYTSEDVETLKVYFPNVLIRYTLSVLGQNVESDVKAIDLSQAGVLSVDALISAISPLANLEVVDVHTASYTFDQYRLLLAMRPGVSFLCTISAYGRTLETSQQDVDLSGATIEDAVELTQILALFPNLQSVDVRNTNLTSAELISLSNSLGGKRLIARVNALGGAHDTIETELTAADGYNADAAQIISELSLFQNLTRVNPGNSLLTEETLAQIQAAYPNVFIAGQYALYGKSLITDSATIDLTGMRIFKFDPLEKAIADFPYLTTVILTDTGISEEALNALKQAHPAIRFVTD